MADGDDVVGRGFTADVLAHGETDVVKLYRAGWSEDAIEAEYRASELAARAGLPTPRPLRRELVDGRSGIVFERVQGATMLDTIGRSPWRLWSLAKTLADLGRQVSAVPGGQLNLLHDRVRRALDRADLNEATRQRLHIRLKALPDGDALCHFDLHPANVMMASAGPTIIDWANASKGDPAGDVAQTLLILRCAASPEGVNSALLRFGRRRFTSLVARHSTRRDPTLSARIDQWMPVLAGARLSENNPGEQENLLQVIADAR